MLNICNFKAGKKPKEVILNAINCDSQNHANNDINYNFSIYTIKYILLGFNKIEISVMYMYYR